MERLEPYRIRWSDSGEIVVKAKDIAQASAEFNRMAMDGEIESHPKLLDIVSDDIRRTRRIEDDRREYISLFLDVEEVIPHNQDTDSFWTWFRENAWSMIDSIRDADPKRMTPEVIESFISVLKHDLKEMEKVKKIKKDVARADRYGKSLRALTNSMQSTLIFLYRIVEEE